MVALVAGVLTWPWFAWLFITLPRCLAPAALYRREAAAGLFCSAAETGGNRTWPLHHHHAIQYCHIIVGLQFCINCFNVNFIRYANSGQSFTGPSQPKQIKNQHRLLALILYYYIGCHRQLVKNILISWTGKEDGI